MSDTDSSEEDMELPARGRGPALSNRISFQQAVDAAEERIAAKKKNSNRKRQRANSVGCGRTERERLRDGSKPLRKDDVVMTKKGLGIIKTKRRSKTSADGVGYGVCLPDRKQASLSSIKRGDILRHIKAEEILAKTSDLQNTLKSLQHDLLERDATILELRAQLEDVRQGSLTPLSPCCVMEEEKNKDELSISMKVTQCHHTLKEICEKEKRRNFARLSTEDLIDTKYYISNINPYLNTIANNLNAQTNHYIPRQYKVWNTDDIIRYICGLKNGKFVPFAKSLLMAFRNANINGKNVKNISLETLTKMGKFRRNSKDCKLLWNTFQSL